MRYYKLQLSGIERFLYQARVGAVACVLLTCTSPGWAQIADANAAQPNQSTVPASDSNILPSESLGADDLLEIRVSYCPELSRTFRVSSDSSLSLPLLHQKLMVGGLTPIEVARALQQALEQEHILTEPTVTISVLEYRSRPVSVVGAVNHPLTFQATGQTTLLDALAKAGGLGLTAGGNIIVSMKRSSVAVTDRNLVHVIAVKDLISGAAPDLNLKIQGGEEIRVPEASKIFVVGNVKLPGVYPMQSDSDTTVVKAIALSKGLDAYSAANAFIYRRNDEGSGRAEIKVPLNRIMAFKSPDIALLPDDILYVPGSDGKRITGRVLNQLAGFGSTAASGMLIYK